MQQAPTVRTKQLGHAELRVRRRRHVTYEAVHTIHDEGILLKKQRRGAGEERAHS